MTDAATEPFFIGMADASREESAELVGSKAALLARMSRLGLPVPSAFVMPTSLCNDVNRKDPVAQRALKNGLRAGYRPAGKCDRSSLRRQPCAAFCLGPIRRSQIDARHARHHSRCWHERRNCSGAHPTDRKPPARLGQL